MIAALRCSRLCLIESRPAVQVICLLRFFAGAAVGACGAAASLATPERASSAGHAKTFGIDW